MQAKPISRKSLSWRFATKYGGLKPYEHNHLNICDLRNAIALGVLKTVFYVMAAVFMAFVMGVVDVLAWLSWMVLNLQLIMPADRAEMLFQALGIIAIAAVVMTCFIFLVRQIPSREEPSAFELAYRSWREKMCYPIIPKD